MAEAGPEDSRGVVVHASDIYVEKDRCAARQAERRVRLIDQRWRGANRWLYMPFGDLLNTSGLIRGGDCLAGS